VSTSFADIELMLMLPNVAHSDKSIVPAALVRDSVLTPPAPSLTRGVTAQLAGTVAGRKKEYLEGAFTDSRRRCLGLSDPKRS